MNNPLHNIIEEWIGDDYSKHICRYNDGEFICECYRKAIEDLRSRIPELEDSISKIFTDSKAVQYLGKYEQYDEEGIRVIASRQAIEETLELINNLNSKTIVSIR